MSFLGSVEDAEGQSRQQRRIVKPEGRRQKSMAVWRVRGSRHSEWLTSAVLCDDCGREYPEGRDERPECGCLDAELVDTGAVLVDSRATLACALYSPSAKSAPLWGSPPGAYYAAGTALRG
jgi:hypothetical protein